VHPRGEIGVLDVGERYDGAGEHHRVEAPQCLGRGVDDVFDGAGVLDVEFERRATERLGQLGQQVHAPRRHGYLRAAFGGTDGDGMADSRGCSDDQEP
jgi:hypothetical protein